MEVSSLAGIYETEWKINFCTRETEHPCKKTKEDEITLSGIFGLPHKRKVDQEEITKPPLLCILLHGISRQIKIL